MPNSPQRSSITLRDVTTRDDQSNTRAVSLSSLESALNKLNEPIAELRHIDPFSRQLASELDRFSGSASFRSVQSEIEATLNNLLRLHTGDTASQQLFQVQCNHLRTRLGFADQDQSSARHFEPQARFQWLSQGGNLLKQIERLIDFESQQIEPSTATINTTLLELGEAFTVCGPGSFNKLEALASQLKDHVICPTPANGLKAFKLALFNDVISNHMLANPSQYPEAFPGNEIHVVNAWRNHFAEEFGLDTTIDLYASSRLASSPTLEFALREILEDALLPSNILAKYGNQCLDTIRELVQGKANTPEECTKKILDAIQKFQRSHANIDIYDIVESPMSIYEPPAVPRLCDSELISEDPSRIVKRLIHSNMIDGEIASALKLAYPKKDLSPRYIEISPSEGGKLTLLTLGNSAWMEQKQPNLTTETSFARLANLPDTFVQELVNRLQSCNDIDSQLIYACKAMLQCAILTKKEQVAELTDFPLRLQASIDESGLLEHPVMLSTFSAATAQASTFGKAALKCAVWTISPKEAQVQLASDLCLLGDPLAIDQQSLKAEIAAFLQTLPLALNEDVLKLITLAPDNTVGVRGLGMALSLPANVHDEPTMLPKVEDVMVQLIENGTVSSQQLQVYIETSKLAENADGSAFEDALEAAVIARRSDLVDTLLDIPQVKRNLAIERPYGSGMPMAIRIMLMGNRDNMLMKLISACVEANREIGHHCPHNLGVDFLETLLSRHVTLINYGMKLYSPLSDVILCKDFQPYLYESQIGEHLALLAQTLSFGSMFVLTCKESFNPFAKDSDGLTLLHALSAEVDRCNASPEGVFDILGNVFRTTSPEHVDLANSVLAAASTQGNQLMMHWLEHWLSQLPDQFRQNAALEQDNL